VDQGKLIERVVVAFLAGLGVDRAEREKETP
jgi:hypothetical protein